jgi:hypothetical protein
MAETGRFLAVPAADLKWEALVPGSPVKISVLWGDYNKGPFGMLLKQPGGLEGPMHTHASDYWQYHSEKFKGSEDCIVYKESTSSARATSFSRVPARQRSNENLKECLALFRR